MLDDRERRALERLEHELASADPLLARRMRRALPTWRRWATWRVLLAAVGVTLAVGLVVLGLAGQALLVLVILSWPLVAHMRAQRPRGDPAE
ncbi:DUF3040 domain-containing protein [Actinomycetospora cinnamomea]|uniref:DUF3040 family protein n=1 Tax=Actinomycetospora cinnamomea TaxID=663609 RepID=A0A2U1FBE0_9PSEU|nr:DUF3040 domain-containing protein [Actinomycetospora cinnamomea]PVZ09502.1 hypothetical protein C8D89_106165 [Actinomycetospora cinnamomea]